jgi:hypothetical protein
VVVVEGSYLLVDAEPWSQVKPLLDEAWFCVTPPESRMDRLVDRHTRHGRSAAAARLRPPPGPGTWTARTRSSLKRPGAERTCWSLEASKSRQAGLSLLRGDNNRHPSDVHQVLAPTKELPF